MVQYSCYTESFKRVKYREATQQDKSSYLIHAYVKTVDEKHLSRTIVSQALPFDTRVLHLQQSASREREREKRKATFLCELLGGQEKTTTLGISRY